eukprot:SAG11_NODE_5730_length_1477_cov_0.889695_2_plen_225_part_00
MAAVRHAQELAAKDGEYEAAEERWSDEQQELLRTVARLQASKNVSPRAAAAAAEAKAGASFTVVAGSLWSDTLAQHPDPPALADQSTTFPAAAPEAVQQTVAQQAEVTRLEVQEQLSPVAQAFSPQKPALQSLELHHAHSPTVSAQPECFMALPPQYAMLQRQHTALQQRHEAVVKRHETATRKHAEIVGAHTAAAAHHEAAAAQHEELAQCVPACCRRVPYRL